MLTGLGAIPVERAGGRAALSAFDAAIPALKGGTWWWSTRRAPARRTAGSTGGAPAWPGWRVAAGVPIIPVGMIGTDKVQPIGAPGAPAAAPRKITVKFGKPLDFTGRPDDRTSLRQMTDEVMSRDPEAHRPGVRAALRPAARPPGPDPRRLTGRPGPPRA